MLKGRLVVWAFCLLLALGALYSMRGHSIAAQFLVGVSTEVLFSMDNALVLVLGLSLLNIGSDTLRKLVMWGVMLAVVGRGAVFYGLGAFVAGSSWFSLMLGLLLMVGSVRALFGKNGVNMHPIVWNLRHLSKRMARRGALMLNQAKFISFVVVVVIMEIVNAVLSVDSVSALMAVSRDPVVLMASSLFGITLTRIVALEGGLAFKLGERYGGVVPVVMFLLGGKMLLGAVV